MKLDKNGQIPAKPMAGYEICSIAGTSMILEVQYFEDLHSIETGRTATLALALNPESALLLADALRKQAQMLLHSAANRGPVQ